MTNSPPENPRNPIPERRKRPPAGVTFDEMIGIIVAMTTIGAILFWSLGSKKGGFANNFGLGGDNNLLSSDTNRSTGFGIGKASSDVNYGEEESNQRESKARSRREKSSVAQELPIASAPPKQELNLSSEDFSSKANSQSRRFGSVGKLAPLAGVATLPALKTPAGENKGDATPGDVDSETGEQADSKATTPDKSDTGEQADSKATTPDKSDTGEQADSKATTSDKSDTGEQADSKATTPDKSDTGEQADSKATTPDKTEMPNDVEPSYWAYPFVKQMSDKALVPDFADDQNFEPDKLITRATMATLIGQAFDTQPEIQGVKEFKDVTNKNAIADIDKAVRTGFMQGYSDKEFRPEEEIPRYQVLVTLATGLGLKPSQDADQVLQKFGDGTDMPDWAKKQVAAAAEAGLIVNPPNVNKSSLKPNQSATRGEVAAMIHQALVKNGKLKPLKSEYILKP